MPVATRNQSKNISAAFIQEVKKPVSNPVLTQQVITKVRPDPNNILPWFSSVIKEGLADIEKSNAEKTRIVGLVEANPKDKKYEKEFRTHHDNTVRRVTEVMYFIEQYYPEVRNLSPGMVRFGEVLYKKVHELYDQIHSWDIDTKPKTEEEKQSLASLIYTLQDVEKMIIPFLPQEHSIKRKRNFVDYTGMDTIEPYDEYDGITNIWLDTTVFCDPDYEFEEDEDDDLDRYVVYEDEEDEEFVEPDEDEHDYSEDEDYIPEEEEVVSKISARVTAGPKFFKEGNHTWFIYDDEC